jgi:hypothetical protein
MGSQSGREKWGMQKSSWLSEMSTAGSKDEKAKDSFRKSHPCPSTGKTTGTCSRYAIDM